ncbi:helix-turn-helix domain-containing protein [Roseateles violae]|uniref:Helix-turn-helix domain-containing protein n=1 Tax=Roseateles violae TaxID=3058042 RepID=A0ABT8DNW8_9BURK|nr:helix-turn-helix domain-containing protein [Pelomonas sp. PFR6]MDN3920060.1 helix-turn-helix domain-containing protein [Pelomonas sp. PFR6]
MLIAFEDRPSDSPLVERVWRSRSEQAGSFHSMASCNWVMVVSRVNGRVFMTVRGPETRASVAECPPDGEWIGIHFRLGSFMPEFPNRALRDRNDSTLPDLSGLSFWLAGSAWEYPSFDNADVFVERLRSKGLLASDPYVRSALERRPGSSSRRTEQRHFLRASGITQVTARQIERARRAAYCLQNGLPILQVVHDMGYFDQAHLSRSMQHFIGRTPAQVARGEGQLSLLYKPDELRLD